MHRADPRHPKRPTNRPRHSCLVVPAASLPPAISSDRVPACSRRRPSSRNSSAAMPEIAVTILGITGLLALVSLLPPVAHRLNLPFSVLLALAGCALGIVVFFGQNLPISGLLGDFVVALRGFEISPEALLYIFLPTLLFEAALMIDVRRLMDDVVPILLLAVVAVVVCTLVVGFAL